MGGDTISGDWHGDTSGTPCSTGFQPVPGRAIDGARHALKTRATKFQGYHRTKTAVASSERAQLPACLVTASKKSVTRRLDPLDCAATAHRPSIPNGTPRSRESDGGVHCSTRPSLTTRSCPCGGRSTHSAV